MRRILRQAWPYIEIGSAVVGWLCILGALLYLAVRLAYWR
jgi:hypothetical protein